MTEKNTNNTWRQQNLDIAPNGVTDVYFFDTKPNAFYIQNNSDTEIYIGMTATPTAEKYDVLIDRYSNDTFGKPTPCNRLYILNPSDHQISISIYSASNMFDMMLLKNFRVAIEKGALNAIKYDGIINGIKSGVKIPVILDKEIKVNMPDKLTVEATVPEDTQGAIEVCAENGASIITMLNMLMSTSAVNNKTTLCTIASLLASIANNTGGTTVISGNVNAVMSYKNVKSGRLTSGTTIPFAFKEIDTIVNDSDDELEITLSSGNVFYLKKDETLSDVQLTGSSLTFASKGKVNCRYILLG